MIGWVIDGSTYCLVCANGAVLDDETIDELTPAQPITAREAANFDSCDLCGHDLAAVAALENAR